jgi:hypothetical protein
MIVEKSIEIFAAAEKIWPFFIEPEKVLQWCITFKKFEYTGEQHSGAGATIYIEEQAGGPLMKLHFQVIECKENKKLVLQMTSGNGVKSYQQWWHLEALPGGSRFTFKEEVVLPYGVIGKLIGLVLGGESAKTVDKMLAKLKSLAEA